MRKIDWIIAHAKTLSWYMMVGGPLFGWLVGMNYTLYVGSIFAAAVFPSVLIVAMFVAMATEGEIYKFCEKIGSFRYQTILTLFASQTLLSKMNIGQITNCCYEKGGKQYYFPPFIIFNKKEYSANGLLTKLANRYDAELKIINDQEPLIVNVRPYDGDITTLIRKCNKLSNLASALEKSGYGGGEQSSPVNTGFSYDEGPYIFRVLKKLLNAIKETGPRSFWTTH